MLSPTCETTQRIANEEIVQHFQPCLLFFTASHSDTVTIVSPAEVHPSKIH